jgi:hypothetical protein
MRKSLLLLGGALLVGGCNEGSAPDGNAAANAAATAPAKPKVRHYCFYKKDAQKGWSASRDGHGNVVVKGKAHLDDVRYKAELGQPEVSGTSAKLWLSTTTNTSYAAPDNWWDVSFTIPDSAAVTEVTVNCDAERVFAELKVAAKK